MKILFGALHSGYYRNLESVVEELAVRGHRVHLGVERADSAFGGTPIVERLLATYDNVSSDWTPQREDEFTFLAGRTRLGLDYLRYRDPVYRNSGLVGRAEIRTPRGMLWMSRRGVLDRPAVRRAVARTLDAIDVAMPESEALGRFLDEQRPDLVVITPLIGLVASAQLDLLRSALARRIPTAVVIWSWDHLSSKAVIRDAPDALFVWNDVQKAEAVEMHGVPPDQVVVTGAHCYDRWFLQRPSRPRAEFVRRAGLHDDRPYVVWACSALLRGSPPEPEVFMRWATHLRSASDSAVRNVGILIRPHPARTSAWESVDWRQFGAVALFGQAPVDAASRADYFDSLHYSSAVVGITTSAFIEAAIAGAPVMSFLSDDLRQEHQDSLHFQHLLNVEDGLLTVARSLDEHREQLGAILDGGAPQVVERQRRFIRSFVRPCGLDIQATTVAADALEELVVRSRAGRSRAPTLSGKAGLGLLRLLERHPRSRSWFLTEREAERQKQKARAAAAT